MKQTIWAVLVAALLMTGLPLGIVAQTPGSPDIRSESGESLERLQFQLEPGESERTSLQLTGDTASFRIASVTSPPNGGIEILDAATPAAEPATWLTLDSGSGDNRTLTVTVPRDAKPGQYLAALVLDGTQTTEASSPGDLPQWERAVTTVTITVPGEMEAAFSLGRPTVIATGTVRLVIPIQNTGAIPLAPAGELALQPAEGKPVTIPLALGVILPGVSTTVDVVLPPGLESGTYEITLTLSDASSAARAQIEATSVDIPDITTGAAPLPDATASSDITIQNPEIEFVGSPITSATVSAEIANTGSPVAAATVVLDVRLDGQLIESVPIVEFARITDGSVNFSTTYVPESPLTSGLWSFRLRLEVPGPDGEPETIAQTGTFAKIDVP